MIPNGSGVIPIGTSIRHGSRASMAVLSALWSSSGLVGLIPGDAEGGGQGEHVGIAQLGSQVHAVELLLLHPLHIPVGPVAKHDTDQRDVVVDDGRHLGQSVTEAAVTVDRDDGTVGVADGRPDRRGIAVAEGALVARARRSSEDGGSGSCSGPRSRPGSARDEHRIIGHRGPQRRGVC